MGLHSIAIDADDPRKMQVGISVGGVYTSTDGGASWTQDNAQTGGKEDRPDVFYCIHKLLAHPRTSGVRFMRVHVDVFWREPGETPGGTARRSSATFGSRREHARAIGAYHSLTKEAHWRRIRHRCYNGSRGATWKRHDMTPTGAARRCAGYGHGLPLRSRELRTANARLVSLTRDELGRAAQYLPTSRRAAATIDG